MIFFALVFIQLFGFLSKVFCLSYLNADIKTDVHACLAQIKDDDGAFVQGIKVLVMVTFISWCVYPVLWVLGSEGLGSISLDLEVRKSRYEILTSFFILLGFQPMIPVGVVELLFFLISVLFFLISVCFFLVSRWGWSA